MPSKKQVFKSFWISFKDRLPPENDDHILIWIPIAKTYSVSLARIVRAQQEQLREKLITLKTLNNPGMKITGYYATHWMKIYAP